MFEIDRILIIPVFNKEELNFVILISMLLEKLLIFKEKKHTHTKTMDSYTSITLNKSS